MTRLKRCPFCGGKAYIERGRVECSNPFCGASVEFPILGKEREAWNNRILESLLKQTLETLSKIKLRANEERSMCGVTFDFAFEIEELADELIDELKKRGVLK